MRVMLLVIAALFAGVFIFGMTYFPDAPIYPDKSGGFRGKYGAVHTEEMYDHYVLWSRVTIVLFLVTFVGLVLSTLFPAKKDEANRPPQDSDAPKN